jgi:hypothetical protein
MKTYYNRGWNYLMKYNILGVPIEVDTHLCEVNEYLLNIYSYFRGKDIDEPKIHYTATSEKSTTWEGNSYSIHRNGRIVGNYAYVEEFLLELEHIIMDDVMMQLTNLFFVHAAVLVKNKEAVILAGPSHAGKSTLAMALSRRGYYYLSDEVAPIEPKNYMVYPFPRGIKLRKEVLEVLALQDCLAGKRQYIVDVGNKDIIDANSSFEIKYILFPTYVPSKVPELTPVSAAIALGMLAKCSLNFHTFGGDPLSFLTELVMNAGCYKFVTNELDRSCKVIEKLFHSPKCHLGI